MKIQKRLTNPWDDVYRENGNVLGLPYRGFDRYIENVLTSKEIKVLDLGCGTGRHAIPLYDLGYRPYGFDISNNAIDQLKAKLNESGYLTDRIIVSDMFEWFPYEDSFFDSVFSIATIYHGTMANINSAISEVTRVLRPGGIFYFTTSVNIEHSKSINSGSNYVLLEKNTYLPLDGREKHLVHHYFTRDELLDLLEAKYTDINVAFDGDNYFEVYCTKK